jgi:hypothetical protein
MRTLATLGGAALLVASTTWAANAPGPGEPVFIKAPMVCSRGPDEQYFETHVTIPPAAPTGSTYAVRIQAAPSPKISGIGLNYLHDMLTDFYVPEGASYVAGSAHVVDGTGSENVRPGARALYDRGFVRLHLPGHVENGSTFTPPALEFQLRVTAAPGASLPVRWVRHRVTANVFLLGNLDVVCTPEAGALTLGTTGVTPAPP